MERRQQWMGYVAIGLGLLALVVALAGRGSGPHWSEFGYGIWERPVPPVHIAPAAPAPPAPAAPPQAPRVFTEEEFAFRHRGGPPFALLQSHAEWGHWHPGMMIFWPGMLLGHLIKLALLVLLIGLGLRLLRGSRGPYGGPPATGGDSTPSGPPSGGTPTMGPTVRL